MPGRGNDAVEEKAGRADIGAAFAEAVARGARVLRCRLEEEGVPRAVPKRFDSEECRLECLLFEWFLAEVAVSTTFGRRSPAIGQAMRRRLLADLDRSGLSPAVLVNLERTQRERFAEYAAAFQAGSSLQVLGGRAWSRIQGADEPSDRMTMLLAVWASAELEALQRLGARHRRPGGWRILAGRVPSRPVHGVVGPGRRGLPVAFGVAGLLGLAVGAGMLAQHVVAWLDTQRWEAWSLLDLLSSPAVRPALPPGVADWLSASGAWYGLHAVLIGALDSVPAALSLAVVGAALAWWALRD